MTSPVLERLRAARAAKSGTVAPEVAAAVAEEIQTLVEKTQAAAGSINPPGEACEPPPDPKLVKEEAKATKEAEKAAKKALKASAAPKAAVVEAPATVAPSDVKLATLYVDCFPIKRFSNDVELVEASELIAQANEIVAEELNVPHYCLVDYGKGRGALHVALQHVIANRNGTFNVLLSTRSSAGLDALQAFTEAAAVVIRGAA